MPKPQVQPVEIQREAVTKDLRVSLDERVQAFVRRMEFKHEVSKSAVVEVALLRLMLFGDEEVGVILREANASQRRR